MFTGLLIAALLRVACVASPPDRLMPARAMEGAPLI